MSKDSVTSSIFIDNPQVRMGDSCISSILKMPNLFYCETAQSAITGIRGASLRDSLSSSVLLIMNKNMNNFVTVKAKQGNRIRFITPSVKVSGTYHSVPYGKIFINGKWHVISNAISYQKEVQILSQTASRQNQGLIDSVVNSIHIN